MSRPTHRLTTSALVSALTLLALALPARAQIGELAGFREAMQRQYLNRDLQVITDSLLLDQVQRDILENLYEDYKTNFEAGVDAMQERLRSMKDELQGGDQSRILSLIFQPFEDWNRERLALGREFIDSIKLILSEDQLELWPAFEQRLLREKSLPRGSLSGESTNLFYAVRDLRLPEGLEIAVQPVLAEYAAALDQALRARDNLILESQSKVVKTLRDTDPRQALVLLDKQIAARIVVRQVNDRYIDMVTAALPEQYSGRFRREAMERAYPKAYRDTAGQRLYRAAAELDTLDEAAMQSVLDLQEVFLSELEMINQRVVELLRESEPIQARNRMELYAARMLGETPSKKPDAALAELRTRDQLDRRYAGLLRSAIGDDQFEQLPGAERFMPRRTSRGGGKYDATGKRKRSELAGDNVKGGSSKKDDSTIGGPRR